MHLLLIGLPNVGKSSIYNILTKNNKNIIHSKQGTTRDWHSDYIEDCTGMLIYDTPGIIFKNNKLNFNQLNSLINRIDIFLYVVDYKITNVSSFVFFNNSLIVQMNNQLKAYNLKNGNIFWSLNIEKTINQKNRIIKAESFNNKLYVFFDNGKILIIQSDEIINIIDLKVKNINLLYFQGDKLLVSLENGKTVLF